MCDRRSIVIGAVRSLLVGVGLTWAEPPECEIISLGTLGGFSRTALAINNHGQVVSGAGTVEGLHRAYSWDPDTGQMTDLGTLGGEIDSASGKAVPQDRDG